MLITNKQFKFTFYFSLLAMSIIACSTKDITTADSGSAVKDVDSGESDLKKESTDNEVDDSFDQIDENPDDSITVDDEKDPEEETPPAEDEFDEPKKVAELPSPAPTCAGIKIYEACWYLGGKGQSCNDTCAGHNGYSEATNTIVGTAGSDAACNAVLNALGGNASRNLISSPGKIDASCSMINMDVKYRWRGNPTTAEGRLNPYMRACACQN